MAVSRDRTPPPGRLPHQLPRGRHGLSKTFVKANQRERLLAAVAETVTSMGYVATAVEDILACAGVSRRTFYDMFGNKEEAFLAAYDEGAARLLRGVEAAAATDRAWRDRARDSVAAFLDALAEAPELAHLCIVDVLAAGPRALARREATKDRLVEVIEEGREHAPRELAVPRVAAQTIVGGMYDVIHSHIVRSQTRSLPQLLPELAYMTFLPFLGQRAAADEYRRMRSQATSAKRRSSQAEAARHTGMRPPCAA